MSFEDGQYLGLNTRTQLSSPLTAGGLVILHSPQLFPTPEHDAYIDNTNVNFYNAGGNNILHISFRRAEQQIVFNTAPEGYNWEQEERVALPELRSNNTFIIVYDHGNRYQIIINGRTVHYFNKRYGGQGLEVSYEVNEYTKNSFFSDTLNVQPAHIFA